MRFIYVLILLTGCAGQSPVAPDFFDRRTEFAADRERETIDIGTLEYDSACVHVTEVLMDMNCELQEVNTELGLISTRPISGRFGGTRKLTCARHQVTVSVVQQSGGDIAVRASFHPPNMTADRTFQTLLRRSISQQVPAG